MEKKHLEDSPQSNGWNNFKRHIVSCIRRVHEVTGLSLFQQKAMNSIYYLDMLELYAAHRWHSFNQTFSFNKLVPLHTRALQ
jgi:hypothetical protein